MLSTIVELIST